VVEERLAEWVDLQDAAVRMTSRAQWFLMSLPMLAAWLPAYALRWWERRMEQF